MKLEHSFSTKEINVFENRITESRKFGQVGVRLATDQLARY